MILTDMTMTKRGKMALFIDETFAFSIAPELVHDYQLHIGDERDSETLDTLRAEAMEKTAKSAAINFLSYRDYTGAELKKRLRDKVGEDAAEQAVVRMQELGLINDENYAERYARTLSRKGYGERRIAMEMQRKGLSSDLIETSVEELEVDQAAQAADFLRKKYSLWREDPAVKRRAFAALTRRGFRYDDIKSAMDNLEYEE